MKAKTWFFSFVLGVVFLLCVLALLTYRIDPYFHFHAPHTDRYYYLLYNQRSQNNGITRHFDYDAVITGSSMTVNFKTSEFDALFGTHSVKLPYSGGSYKEIDENLSLAFQTQPKIRMVVRALDKTRYFDNKDSMWMDPNTLPNYLYDQKLWNDAPYFWNRDLLFSRLLPMALHLREEYQNPGIDSFDSYARWQNFYTFGRKTVHPGSFVQTEPKPAQHLTEEEKERIRENIELHVLQLTREHPETTFCYFLPPYSVLWWEELRNNGNLEHHLEAEEYILSLLVDSKNLRVYGFDDRTDLTTNLNHYMDSLHYAEWINSLILHWIAQDEHRLTRENYRAYVAAQKAFYGTYDFTQLNTQKDYGEDWLAAAFLHPETIDQPPLSLLQPLLEHGQVTVPSCDGRIYLVFSGTSLQMPAAEVLYVEDGDGKRLASYKPTDSDDGTVLHLLTLPKTEGSVRIVYDPLSYRVNHLTLY